MQHLWIYMEAILAGSRAIGRVLPAEVKRFANFDRQWIKIIEAARDNTNVVRLCCTDDELANLLPQLPGGGLGRGPGEGVHEPAAARRLPAVADERGAQRVPVHPPAQQPQGDLPGPPPG